MFMDDIHMPQADSYKVKQPLELLRQLMDYGGWYDTKISELTFKQFANMTMVASCNSVDEMSLRHTRH